MENSGELSKSKLPFINCHTHIFTGNHVPPWLAKTFVPAPFYRLLNVHVIVGLFRWWYHGLYHVRFKPYWKTFKGVLYKIKIFIQRQFIVNLLYNVSGIVLTVNLFYFIWNYIADLRSPTGLTGILNRLYHFLTEYDILWHIERLRYKILLTVALLLLFSTGRNLILFVLKKTIHFFKILPGPKTRELAQRYLNIGRYAFHTEQSMVFEQLRQQYPAGTKFVVLPMDMEFMDAGKLPESYYNQMTELLKLKKSPTYGDQVIPFIFADPRRVKDPAYFSYKIEEGKIILANCFIKSLIDNGFAGFKTYPALGFYPFDEDLLILWKYAADNGFPIMTHCIRGTIFYRGKKHKNWDTHPVFEQQMGKLQSAEPLLLPEKKNVEFINNFTHPLNYLCVLDGTLLLKIISKSANPKLKEAFGYDESIGSMKYNLSHLKICFAHFGGDDEWKRFLELDRSDYGNDVFKYPQRGVEFFCDRKGNPTPGKLEQVWRGLDWYSIICSLILQHPNVYADLSYIIHNSEAVFPLLKLTLQNPVLRTRILYGTDFYVVRNHKSDKNIRADVANALSDDEFDQIARVNPNAYLNIATS